MTSLIPFDQSNYTNIGLTTQALRKESNLPDDVIRLVNEYTGQVVFIPAKIGDKPNILFDHFGKKQLLAALMENNLAKAYELFAKGYVKSDKKFNEYRYKWMEKRCEKALALLGDDRIKSFIGCDKCRYKGMQVIFKNEDHLREVHDINDVMIKAIKNLMTHPVGEQFLLFHAYKTSSTESHEFNLLQVCDLHQLIVRTFWMSNRKKIDEFYPH